MNTIIEGTLEIDRDRGVIYFHNKEGRTVLRICRLPKQQHYSSIGEYFIDITHMVGVSWTIQ
jgi:hypothetical protein